MKGPGSTLGCDLFSFNKNNLTTFLSDLKMATTVYKRDICSDFPRQGLESEAQKTIGRRPDSIENRGELVSSGARTVKSRL